MYFFRIFICAACIGTGTNRAFAEQSEIKESFIRKFELSLGPAGLNAFVSGPDISYTGLGGSFVWCFLPHILEFELVAHALASEATNAAPVDILLRKPWFLTEVIQPYIAFGPTVLAKWNQDSFGFGWGLASAYGIDLWFTKHWGVFAEFNYNYIVSPKGFHEIGSFAGLVAGID